MTEKSILQKASTYSGLYSNLKSICRHKAQYQWAAPKPDAGLSLPLNERSEREKDQSRCYYKEKENISPENITFLKTGKSIVSDV